MSAASQPAVGSAPNNFGTKKARTSQAERDFEIYYARVLLREAAARRAGGSFHAILCAGAAEARRRAAAIVLKPQRDLFEREPA